MGGEIELRENMPVVSPDQQVLGEVEEIHGDGFDVQGMHLQLSDVAEVEQGTVQLEDTERVHVVERRLKAEAEHGVNAPVGTEFEDEEARTAAPAE